MQLIDWINAKNSWKEWVKKENIHFIHPHPVFLDTTDISKTKRFWKEEDPLLYKLCMNNKNFLGCSQANGSSFNNTVLGRHGAVCELK